MFYTCLSFYSRRGVCLWSRGKTPPWADTSLLADTPWADTPHPVLGKTSPFWAGTPLGRHSAGQTPPCPVHAGICPGPVHAGIHPSLPSACWDTPPCAVYARIRSTSRRYTSHWNAFLFCLFIIWFEMYTVCVSPTNNIISYLPECDSYQCFKK